MLVLFVLMLCDLSLSIPAPVDTVIVQVQQWMVVGTQRVLDQALLNGVSLKGTSQGVDSIVQTMSAAALPPAISSGNQNSVLRNHTILRSRECILEGSELHWSDRVFYDGTVYLSLGHDDSWIAHVPEAHALKMLWDQEAQRTRTERIRLQEGCINLMRELRLSEEQSVPQASLPPFLIPVIAFLVFTGLIVFSLLLSKKHGLRHPGGVIGSVIHYPKNMTEMPPETKGSGYRTL